MSVRVTKIDNGLTVVTDAMPRLETAALGVWIGVGSRAEKRHQHGISHLLEHMAFKGTRRRTARMIAEEIEAAGGEVNAATSVENTAYYARVLKADVPLALDILSDILIDSVFDAGELRREQHVIVQEIGAAFDSPDDRVFDLFQEAAYPDQALGRSILGTQDAVSGFDPDALRHYLDVHYKGPAIVIGAAGAIDHDEIVRIATERFSPFRAETGPSVSPARYVGGEKTERRPLMEAQVTLGFEGRPFGHEDYFAAQLFASVLGGGMSSRLFQEVRENRGLCYSVYAFHWAFSDTGLFAIHAATGAEDLGELMPVIGQELLKVADGIGADELDRARNQMKAGLLMALESPATRAGQIARQILLYGRPLTTEELSERIHAVTLADISRLAGEIVTRSTPTLAAVGPVETLISADEIAERLRSGSMALHG